MGDNLLDLLRNRRLDLEDQLIVNAVDELGIGTGERVIEKPQRALEEIGGRSLNRRILANATKGRLLRRVRDVVGEDPETPGGGPCAAFLDRTVPGLLQPTGDGRIGAKVALDQRVGLDHPRVKTTRQPLGAHAIHQSIVEPLGILPLSLGDLIDGQAKHLRRRLPVEIDPPVEGGEERGIPREVREDAHLDLGVVGDDQLSASRSTKAGAVIGRVRNLLQAGGGRGNAPRRSANLPKIGVEPTCHGVDHSENVLAEGREVLAEVAVFEEMRDHGVLLRQLVQAGLLGVFDVKADPGESVADLCWTVEIDRLRPPEEAQLR